MNANVIVVVWGADKTSFNSAILVASNVALVKDSTCSTLFVRFGECISNVVCVW